jgi:uncharacterized protein YjiS (DUF1127 family)
MISVAAQHEALSSYPNRWPRRWVGAKKGNAMIVAILNFLQSWRRYNASLNELNQLGDRELADIGISRSDIPRVAWDSANH